MRRDDFVVAAHVSLGPTTVDRSTPKKFRRRRREFPVTAPKFTG
jgi:hypothetical protein